MVYLRSWLEVVCKGLRRKNVPFPAKSESAVEKSKKRPELETVNK